MAQLQLEYEAIEDFNVIAAKIVEKYPSIFNGVPVEEVRCYAITNKERAEGKKLWTVSAVPQPIRLDCQYGWYVVLFQKDWEDLGKESKQLLVASILCSIGEEGKVNPFDLKDYGVMVRTFGVDYLDKKAPDILDENVDVNWIVRSEA